ncbi:hypothetical protein P153DRAFT_383195 [Dothidotthia symphoricarpi CBS 119687]|uniref:RING-type domain-containing protein n=1 Tax=Dothidotthia symphoricarpi CBS 119687 TaxID=1392245 RepID=A0A6A6AMJ0_9PLEO|nr:uncharacterized protein P153DRAFT_383195 [Dothidotthia symphoricarpi CBS 119687]KAF2132305.1 hypothetical protein P153DRAFT_383195 [Dothidotthia symphoricarpi CBS 119687]
MSSTFENPPTLPVFINSQLERIAVVSLPAQPAEARNCTICKQPMCDYLHTQKASHTCDDLSACELAIRVSAPNCGHMFGSRCLERYILHGHVRCPVCRRTWYQKAEVRRQTLKESYPWLSDDL